MFRYHSTSDFAEITLSCRMAFSKRSWPYLIASAIPWLVLSGQRSVRRLSARAAHLRHESSYYRFFSRFKFRTELFFKCLFDLIVQTFALREILIVVDDTLCPKWGKHIFGTACFFDHVRRPRPGFLWGHNWIVLAVVVSLGDVPVALPFWIALYRPQKICSREEFRTRLQIVAQVLEIVRSWTSLPVALVADGAYNNKSLLGPLAKLSIPLVSRLRLDAVLRKDLPAHPRRKRGRKPKYGPRFPRLQAIARSARGWCLETAHIYSSSVSLKIKSFDAWWPKAGIKIRVVITRDPKGKRNPCFLASTDLTLTPIQIVERFAHRWPIEQLFSDVKLQVGLDSAEVRTPKSVLRHAILAFGLVTWVRVWAKKKGDRFAKASPSFARQLSVLRGDFLAQTISASIPSGTLSKRILRDLAALGAAA